MYFAGSYYEYRFAPFPLCSLRLYPTKLFHLGVGEDVGRILDPGVGQADRKGCPTTDLRKQQRPSPCPTLGKTGTRPGPSAASPSGLNEKTRKLRNAGGDWIVSMEECSSETLGDFQARKRFSAGMDILPVLHPPIWTNSGIATGIEGLGVPQPPPTLFPPK